MPHRSWKERLDSFIDETIELVMYTIIVLALAAAISTAAACM